MGKIPSIAVSINIFYVHQLDAIVQKKRSFFSLLLASLVVVNADVIYLQIYRWDFEWMWEKNEFQALKVKMTRILKFRLI
jgi:hypothetical protein